MKVALVIAAVLLPYVSAGLLGGIKPVDLGVNDEPVGFATSAINDYFFAKNMNGDEQPHEAVKVIKATRQLVAGYLYRLTIKMSNNQICDIQVLDQAWSTPRFTSSKLSCKPNTEDNTGMNGSLLGGEKDADFDDEMVKQALSAVTDNFNKMTNSMYRVVPSGGSVTKQVVNGIIIRFKDVPMKTSTCRNTEENFGLFAAEDCPVDANSVTNHGRVNAKVYCFMAKCKVQNMDILE